MERRGFLWIGMVVAVLLLALPAGASAARKLSIHDAQVTEPEPGQTVTAKFKVTLSKKSDKKVTVGYGTANGSATHEAGDYEPATGFVKIRPHHKATKIKITVNGDDDYEGTEQFGVVLADAHGARIDVTGAHGTILDDDAADDADGDGIPNGEDECPDVAAPDGFCPATAYDINQGNVSDGRHVTVSNLLVTAAKSGHSPVWAQVKSGDVGYTGAQFSGLELTGSGLSSADTGDRITVKGVVSNGEVTTSSVQILSELNESVSPVVVTNATLSATDAYDNVYVQLQDVEITSEGNNDWVLTQGPGVDNAIIGTLPTYLAGTDFTFISGIADTAQSPDAVLPRDEDDISAAPLAVESLSTGISGGCINVGDSNVPVAQVTLNSPAPSSTFVTMGSSDTNVATVNSPIGVQEGNTTATIGGNGIAEGTVTLTATLNTSQATAQLQVAAPCP